MPSIFNIKKIPEIRNQMSQRTFFSILEKRNMVGSSSMAARAIENPISELPPPIFSTI